MTHVIYRLGLLSTLFRFLFSHPHPHNRWIYAQGNLGNPVLMKTDFLLTSQRLCPCCQALQDSKREISPRLHYDSIVHPRCTRFLYWGWGVYTWHNSLVEIRGQLQESVLSFYRVDPRNWTQAAWLGSKPSYLLIHLASPATVYPAELLVLLYCTCHSLGLYSGLAEPQALHQALSMASCTVECGHYNTVHKLGVLEQQKWISFYLEEPEANRSLTWSSQGVSLYKRLQEALGQSLVLASAASRGFWPPMIGGCFTHFSASIFIQHSVFSKLSFVFLLQSYLWSNLGST